MKSISKKVILIGHEGVGKTSLVERFVNNAFSEDYLSTIGVRVNKKVIQVDDVLVNLLIWDIAGESRWTQVSKNYFLGSHGCIYVTDLSRPATMSSFIEDIAMIKQNLIQSEVVTVGNKIDLLSNESIRELIEKPIFDFLTSAKNDEHVESVFYQLAKKLINSDL